MYVFVQKKTNKQRKTERLEICCQKNLEISVKQRKYFCQQKSLKHIYRS